MTSDETPSQYPEDDPSGGAGKWLSTTSWEDFGLPEVVLEALQKRGYERPTVVQERTLPITCAGRDLIARSKTGSGKTVAFCLPMVCRTLDATQGVVGLVLAPTRELAIQSAEELKLLAPSTHAVVQVYGGIPIGPQEKALKRDGPKMVVGTPGRILDHIRRGNLDLSEVSVGCLDEADEMLSMGFFEEVTDILDCVPKDAQILLFSATVEERIRQLANRFLTDPEDVFLSHDVELNPDVHHVLFETHPEYPKQRQLLTILLMEEPTSAIIFCNTRDDTNTVAKYLVRQGFDAEPISSALSQKERERVMARIKRGDLDFLVATDIAARGIDISELSHVINYSLPEDPAVYLHRTGRTGRIGKKGTAVSLLGGRELGTRRELETTFGVQFEERTLPTREEADQIQAEHVIRRLRSSAEITAFESWLGAARELLEQKDREMLLAAALRGFFIWEHREERKKHVEPGVVGDEPSADANHEERSSTQNRGSAKPGAGDGKKRRRRRRSPRRGSQDS